MRVFVLRALGLDIVRQLGHCNLLLLLYFLLRFYFLYYLFLCSTRIRPVNRVAVTKPLLVAVLVNVFFDALTVEAEVTRLAQSDPLVEDFILIKH